MRGISPARAGRGDEAADVGGREPGTLATAKKTGQSSGRPAPGDSAAPARGAAVTQVGADLTVDGWEYAPAPESRETKRERS